MARIHAVHHRPTVLIAGAGIAGIEALLALRADLGGTIHIELLSPASELVYRPSSTAGAFGLGDVHRREVAEIAADQHAGFRRDALASVDPHARVVLTAAGERLNYDCLLVATGARWHPAIEGAVTFWGIDDQHDFQYLLTQARAGELDRIAFVAPTGIGWLMPLYELALLTSWWARRHRLALALSLLSDEEAPLEAFGPEVSEVVARLLHESGIEFVADVDARGGAQAVVSLPRPEGPYVEGLPHDEHGFMPVDRHGRVKDVPHVYAAGDGTDFPIKQGGLAAQQADAAAAAIADELGTGTSPEPFAPVLRGMLLTGDLPRFLRGSNGRSEVGIEPLWWPPAKVAARYLAPYLAHRPLSHALLTDRPAPEDAEEAEQDERDGVELLLALADANARRGSFGFALRCLQAAEDLGGPLSAERQADRQAWLRHAAG